MSSEDVADELDELLAIDKKKICDDAAQFLYESYIPNVVYPRITYSILPCKYGSQTENYKKHYNALVSSNLRQILGDDPLNPIKDKILQMEAMEKNMASDYYVVYHAMPRFALFLTQINTLLLSFEKNIPITTLLFRKHDRFWDIDGQTLTSTENFPEFVQYHININDPMRIYERKASETSAGVPTYNLYPKELENGILTHGVLEYKHGLDWFKWYKSAAMSVNLSIYGGTLKEESTIAYFVTSKSNSTSNDIFKLIDDKVNHLIPRDQPDIQTEQKALLVREQFKNLLKVAYKSLYDNQEVARNKSNSILLQIFIKKEIIDKVLLISAPYGCIIPVKASEYLDMMQQNKMNEMQQKIVDIMENHNNYKFPFMKQNTLQRMRAGDMKNNLVDVQGRLVCADINSMGQEGNVIIKYIDSTNNSDDDKMSVLHKIFIKMMIQCKLAGVKSDVFDKYIYSGAAGDKCIVS